MLDFALFNLEITKQSLFKVEEHSNPVTETKFV